MSFDRGEGYIFEVDLVSERLKSVGEELIETEELYFFCAFAASGDLPEVVHLPLGWSLAEVLGVAEEGIVGFAKEGGKDAQSEQKDQPRRGDRQGG